MTGDSRRTLHQVNRRFPCKADGQRYAATARQVGLAERHVRKWAKRFLRDGPAGLADKKRPGRKPVFSPRGGDSSGQNGVRAAG